MTQPGENGDNGEQQVMVIGPDGRPVGMARVSGGSDDDQPHPGGFATWSSSPPRSCASAR